MGLMTSQLLIFGSRLILWAFVVLRLILLFTAAGWRAQPYSFNLAPHWSQSNQQLTEVARLTLPGVERATSCSPPGRPAGYPRSSPARWSSAPTDTSTSKVWDGLKSKTWSFWEPLKHVAVRRDGRTLGNLTQREPLLHHQWHCPIWKVEALNWATWQFFIDAVPFHILASC